MKLSIIIPTYNVKDYIDECLESLLPQLTDECELIIVDDCSTDGTKEKIFGYLTHEMTSKYFQYKVEKKRHSFSNYEKILFKTYLRKKRVFKRNFKT